MFPLLLWVDWLTDHADEVRFLFSGPFFQGARNPMNILCTSVNSQRIAIQPTQNVLLET